MENTGSAGPVEMVVLLVYLAVIVVSIVGMWKVFTKAGKPGWGILVPIYNLYLLVKIAGRPGWWLLLTLIPILNIVFCIILSLDIAKAFGKGVGFAMGLVFLGFVFYPVLGFGEARYQAPVRA